MDLLGHEYFSGRCSNPGKKFYPMPNTQFYVSGKGTYTLFSRIFKGGLPLGWGYTPVAAFTIRGLTVLI